MPVLRATESRILPGRRQQWSEVTRDLKKIVDRHGANLRVLELIYGGPPGTVLISSINDSFETVAKRYEAINSDKEFQALMARAATLPGFPFAEPVETRLAEDITGEVGGAADPLENAQAFQITTLRLRPGKRTAQLELMRQLREARKGAGLRPANLLQVVAGDPAVLAVVRAYANLAEWAEDRAAGEHASAEVIKRAQADPEFPYVDPIAVRVFRDITNQL